MTTPPTTYDQLKASFDTATQERIPHFFVDLPVWETTPPELTTTVKDEPVFHNPTPLNGVTDLEQALAELQTAYPGQLKHVKAKRPVETDPNGETTEPLVKMPHPFSNCSHVDPVVKKGDRDEFHRVINELRQLEGTSEADGELYKGLQAALVPLTKVQDMLPDHARGMQRLKLNFEWMLCQITVLFGQINLALDGKTPNPKNTYNEARTKYIALMRDLDNHEPLLKDAAPGKLGYGRNVKWVYFYPLIHSDDPKDPKKPARIKGVVVVAKWNPHISSSGVPIMHS